MKALLHILLLGENQTIAYRNPLLQQVKKQFPDVAVLDVDSQSGELVLHYAKQMLQDAEQLIVCIDSADANAGFGSIFPLIELMLENPNNQLILFRNEHARLQRMTQARPELKTKQVHTEAELLQELDHFLTF